VHLKFFQLAETEFVMNSISVRPIHSSRSDGYVEDGQFTMTKSRTEKRAIGKTYTHSTTLRYYAMQFRAPVPRRPSDNRLEIPLNTSLMQSTQSKSTSRLFYIQYQQQIGDGIVGTIVKTRKKSLRTVFQRPVYVRHVERKTSTGPKLLNRTYYAGHAKKFTEKKTFYTNVF